MSSKTISKMMTNHESEKQKRKTERRKEDVNNNILIVRKYITDVYQGPVPRTLLLVCFFFELWPADMLVSNQTSCASYEFIASCNLHQDI